MEPGSGTLLCVNECPDEGTEWMKESGILLSWEAGCWKQVGRKKKEQKKSSPSAGSGQFHGAAHLPAESLLFTLSHPGSLAGFFRASLVLHPSTFPIWLLFLTL